MALRDDVAWVVTLDADGQLSAHEAAKLVSDAIRAGAVVAVGIRSEPARITERFASRLLSGVLGIRDPLCGMKAFRIDVLRQHLSSAGSHINMDLVARIVLAGGWLYQAPINTRPRNSGKSRFGGMRSELHILRATFEVLWLALRSKFRKV
jgi:hypothetical protein